MKTIILNTILLVLTIVLTISLNAQIVVENDGDIGIGTSSPQSDIHLKADGMRIDANTTSYLEVSSLYDHFILRPSEDVKGFLGQSNRQFYYAYFKYGKVNAQTITSDARLKKNIEDVDKDWALNTISLLEPKKYDMIEDMTNYTEDQKEFVEKASKDNYGFLAQDIETILPEIVFTENDSIGTKSINYNALIPILVKAVQEQQKMIEELMKSDLSDESQIKSLSADVDETLSLSNAFLSQNHPNPFDQNTVVDFYITKEVKKAILNIYDLQGKQIKSMLIPDREKSNVVIEGNTLVPGVYYYSLIIDGKEVSTKKMILTE